MAKPRKPRITEEEELEQAFRQMTGYTADKKKRHPILFACFILLLLCILFYFFSDQILAAFFH